MLLFEGIRDFICLSARILIYSGMVYGDAWRCIPGEGGGGADGSVVLLHRAAGSQHDNTSIRAGNSNDRMTCYLRHSTTSYTISPRN